jgi:hypothetical protein
VQFPSKASVIAEDVAVMQFTPVEECQDLPVTVINYVEKDSRGFEIVERLRGDLPLRPYVANTEMRRTYANHQSAQTNRYSLFMAQLNCQGVSILLGGSFLGCFLLKLLFL